MRNTKTRNLALTGVFAALVTALTMIHLPLPSESGYVHLGDGVIYLAASILPAPYGIFAAAIGGALADVLSGFANWAPFTFVIKAVNTVPFILCFKYSKNKNKIIFSLSVTAAVISGILTVALYFLASWVLYGSFASAVAEIPGSLVQAIGSGIVYYLMGLAIDSSKIKIGR